MLWGNSGPGWESVKSEGKTLGNRETISRCGELVKLGTSVEKLIEYLSRVGSFVIELLRGKGTSRLGVRVKGRT